MKLNLCSSEVNPNETNLRAIETFTDDLFAPEVIADPYTYYGHLREVDPVHWNPQFRGWIITRYSDVDAMIRNYQDFSSEVPATDPVPPYPQPDDDELELALRMRRLTADEFISQDRPEHLELRKVLLKRFIPAAVEQLRPSIRDSVEELLDQRQQLGGMDIRHDLGVPLPILVIGRMLGIPATDGPILRRLTLEILRSAQPGAGRFQTVEAGQKAFAEYFAPIVDERRATPREDLVSVLADAERRGAYSRPQVMANIRMLMVAGHVTTVNLISNGTLAFIQNPDQWELFRSNPEGHAEIATEECLRFDPPIKSLMRITKHDVEFGGKLIGARQRIRWFIASANRDPEVFVDPDQFDISRSPNPHLAFGAGIHFCLGAFLARIEGQEVFKALASRFDRLELATDSLAYEPEQNDRSLTALPVTWA